jgi:hypothetical protein
MKLELNNKVENFMSLNDVLFLENHSFKMYLIMRCTSDFIFHMIFFMQVLATKDSESRMGDEA